MVFGGIDSYRELIKRTERFQHLEFKEHVVDKVLFLSGTTRGATLESVGRSLGRDFGALGLGFHEISLADDEHFLENLRKVKFEEVKLIYSWASMGLGIMLRQQDGTERDLWNDLGIPFLTFHGDSPAYFFDRHIAPDTKFITIYGFDEHRDLRKRFPLVHGSRRYRLAFAVLDEIPIGQVDIEKKKNGKILFLKNGKDPASCGSSGPPALSRVSSRPSTIWPASSRAISTIPPRTRSTT
jgi:hypothetical protein